MPEHEDPTQHGKPPAMAARDRHRTPARGRPGRAGVAERRVLPSKPGNAARGKGPQFRTQDAKAPTAGRLAMSLTPPVKIRKLQDALHSKAKSAPGYRFYALSDKLNREDILRFAPISLSPSWRTWFWNRSALTADHGFCAVGPTTPKLVGPRWLRSIRPKRAEASAVACRIMEAGIAMHLVLTPPTRKPPPG